MSQHHRMRRNRILDNLAPGTAVTYISSFMSFAKPCEALQVDLAPLTEVQLADIVITLALSRSTSHASHWSESSNDLGQSLRCVYMGIL